jgi:hypothetical protein
MRPQARSRCAREARARGVPSSSSKSVVVGLERPGGLVHVFAGGGDAELHLHQKLGRGAGLPAHLQGLLQQRPGATGLTELQEHDGHRLMKIGAGLTRGLHRGDEVVSGFAGIPAVQGLHRLLNQLLDGHGLDAPRWGASDAPREYHPRFTNH